MKKNINFKIFFNLLIIFTIPISAFANTVLENDTFDKGSDNWHKIKSSWESSNKRIKISKRGKIYKTFSFSQHKGEEVLIKVKYSLSKKWQIGKDKIQINGDKYIVSKRNNGVISFKDTLSSWYGSKKIQIKNIQNNRNKVLYINSVTILQKDNTPPVIEASTFEVSEEASVNEIVGTIKASDEDGDKLTYKINSGNEDGIFSIKNGELIISDNSLLDYETKNKYILNITVSDGKAESSEDITINVTDVAIEAIVHNEIGNNYTCRKAETITEMDGVQTTKKVKVVGRKGVDFYKFTAATNGTLDVKTNAKKIDWLYFGISTNCNKFDIFDYNYGPHNINTINVKSGETIYFAVKNYDYSNNYDYNFTLSFTKELAPGEQTTGFAGPEGEIGSDGIIEGTNTNNSSGTIILVDDDKKDCQNAQYTNINDALEAVENIGSGTIVLCKGNYAAPTRTIKGMSQFGITSNYDTPVGTNINGQINFESLGKLNISHITFKSPNGKGISLNYTDNVNISNVKVDSLWESLSATHINNGFKIKDSHFISKNSTAVEVKGDSNNGASISNVTIGNDTKNKTGSIGISANIKNMVINHTTIYSHEEGIKLSNSPYSKITNSVIYNNTIESIWIDNSSYTEIDNTKILSNSGNGIKITNSPNTKITSSMLESLQLEALKVDNSDNGYFQNNCFVTNTKINDISISEEARTEVFDDGNKGNFYANADCIDTNHDNICDYPFNIVVNHSKIFKDNFPQRKCNIGFIKNAKGHMFLEKLKDINSADNIVETTAVMGANTGITAHTKNSLSIGDGINKEKVNLLVIADVSGSMQESVRLEDGTYTTKLKVTDKAIKLLINKYSKNADVKYDLIQFSTSIDANSGWTDVKTNPVPSLVKGNNTNYYKALREAIDVALNNQPKAEKTIVYFLSDGYDNSDKIDNENFKDYLFNNIVLNPDVFRLYTYGIIFAGNDLKIISIEKDGYKTPDPIIMKTPEDILKELLKTLDYTIEYELINDYNGAFYIDKYTGEIFVKDSSVLDIDNDPNPKVTVKAIDTTNNLEITGDFNITLKKGIDTGATNETCDMFADAVQTRTKNCVSNKEGVIWNGSAVIKNNPDAMLNTCNIDIPKWVENSVSTCETTQCQKSDINGKRIFIDYSPTPTKASAMSQPTTSNTNKEIKRNTEETISNINELVIYGSKYTMKSKNTVNINSLKFTNGSSLTINPSLNTDLNIGSVGIKYDGANNEIIANKNLNNIKIKDLNLDAGNNDIILKGNNSINIENFKIGRGGEIKLEAPTVFINSFNITSSGQGGLTNVLITADSINIGNMSFGQNIMLKVKPLTKGKKLLFKTNSINFSDSSIMELGSGWYYIHNSLNVPGMSNGKSIMAIDENQEIDMYINNNLILGNNPAINANANNGDYGNLPPKNFRIYINGDLETGGGGTTINALVYTEGDIILGSPTYIKGAISANSKVELGEGSEIIYDTSLNSTGFGACPTIEQPKPTVSFFKAWDATSNNETKIIETKIVNQEFKLNIASLSKNGFNNGENIEFNFWLQDVPTGEILTFPALSFNQKIDDIATEQFKINGAYKNIHPVFQICSDYNKNDNQYKIYKLSECNSKCASPLEPRDGNPCIREVQSPEGFATRPLKYTLEFQKANNPKQLLTNFSDKEKGITQKAGENFTVIAKAVDINNQPIENFNEPFELEVKKLDSDMIENGKITPDFNSVESGKLEFEKGKLEFQASYSEVGFAEFKVRDNSEFASIDNIGNNNAYIIPGEAYKAGRFTPYQFNIETVNLRNIKGNNEISSANNCEYNYLNETGENESIYEYGITIDAVNKQGRITKNYTNSFAKNTNVSFNVNWKNVGPSKQGKGSTNVFFIVPAMYWIEGSYTTPVGSEIQATIDILKSIGVDRKKPFEPFAVKLNSEEQIYTNGFSAYDSDISSAYDSGNRIFDISSLINKLYYVYGRVNPIDATSTENGDAKVNVYYEIYTKNKKAELKTILGGNPLIESVNDANWWRNNRHADCDTVQTGDLTITFNTPTTSITNYDYSNNDRDIITVHDTSAKRPLDTTGTIDFSVNNSFLLHNPYSNKKEVRFNVKFIGQRVTKGTPEENVLNMGKTTKSQSRFIK